MNLIRKNNRPVRQLKAMLALLKKNNTEAQKHFIRATDLEKRTSYAYGPPQIPKPSFELSLRVAPNKTLSRQGKEKALKLLAEL